MKTRLLKKIRKRYTITRIDEIASNACSSFRDAKKLLGLPFYVLEDSADEYGSRTDLFGDIKKAKKKLCMWIDIDYSESFRHREQISHKVWWNNK